MSIAPSPSPEFKQWTQAHQQLQAHLADTIGAEVERALDGVNWQHTAAPPVAPPVTPNPGAPTGADPANPAAPVTPQSASAPAPAGPPGVDWEAFRDPNTKMILGKYKDGQEAARGMHSLLHMAKDAMARADAATLEADQLRQRLSTPQPVVVPPARTQQLARPAQIDAVLSKAKENNGSLDAEDFQAIVDGVLTYAQEAARTAVEQDRAVRNVDAQKWTEVDAYMRQNHPDSLRFADEMTLLAATKPEVGRIYNRILSSGDENARLDATVFLWKEYQGTLPPSPPPVVDPAKQAQEHALNVQAQVRKEEVDAARIQAGLTGTGASGAHESAAPVVADAEAIQRAATMMKQLGEPGQGGALWRSLTIAKGLDHPIFDNP